MTDPATEQARLMPLLRARLAVVAAWSERRPPLLPDGDDQDTAPDPEAARVHESTPAAWASPATASVASASSPPTAPSSTSGPALESEGSSAPAQLPPFIHPAAVGSRSPAAPARPGPDSAPTVSPSPPAFPSASPSSSPSSPSLPGIDRPRQTAPAARPGLGSTATSPAQAGQASDRATAPAPQRPPADSLDLSAAPLLAPASILGPPRPAAGTRSADRPGPIPSTRHGSPAPHLRLAPPDRPSSPRAPLSTSSATAATPGTLAVAPQRGLLDTVGHALADSAFPDSAFPDSAFPDSAFPDSDLEERLADILERAALEAGVDLS